MVTFIVMVVDDMKSKPGSEGPETWRPLTFTVRVTDDVKTKPGH